MLHLELKSCRNSSSVGIWDLLLGVVTRDGVCMFVDLAEVVRRERVVTNKQFFFSGNLLEIEMGIVVLKVNCVTPADGLDLGLYVNTRMVMDYFLKKRPSTGDSNPQPSSSSDFKPHRQPILPMPEEDINQVAAEDAAKNISKMDEEKIPAVVDLEQKAKKSVTK
jgi:hypothetical protein